MPLMDCVIITPWVDAADDPSDQPSHHPKLTDDYRHIISTSKTLMDEVPSWEMAEDAAAGAGQGFRAAFGAKPGGGGVGIGVVVPQAIWEELKEEERITKVPVIARHPLFMGPNSDPAEDQFEIYEIKATITQEGIRLYEDWTGQPSTNIVPNPNQFSVHAIMDESVLITLMGDATYFYQSGITIPDDPLNPEGTPPSQHEKPPQAEMTQQHQDDYVAWQHSQGVPVGEGLKKDAKRIIVPKKEIALPGAAAPDALTYGKLAVTTAAYQVESTRDGSTVEKMPDLETIDKIRNRGMRNQIQ